MTQPQEPMTSSSLLDLLWNHTLACPPSVNQGQDGPWTRAPGSAGFFLRAQLEAESPCPSLINYVGEDAIKSRTRPIDWSQPDPEREGQQGDFLAQVFQGSHHLELSLRAMSPASGGLAMGGCFSSGSLSQLFQSFGSGPELGNPHSSSLLFLCPTPGRSLISFLEGYALPHFTDRETEV